MEELTVKKMQIIDQFNTHITKSGSSEFFSKERLFNDIRKGQEWFLWQKLESFWFENKIFQTHWLNHEYLSSESLCQ